ncbi:MAG: aminomethyl-transferring glycine dehydrogenase, partial [Bernardetiaceae bacterium]|nr:aminomethyl-transferring glycine dehydrogenase [Bernardetiaceae bacterium]
MKINLHNRVPFESRHHGQNQTDVQEMLSIIGVDSLETLINQTVPPTIRLEHKLALPESKSEFTFLQSLRKVAAKNQIFTSYIGMGYYETVTPNVILRNILENPGWYTAYTPYQAEIAQGRLEALINYQTMVSELCGMELANASLLDEATAAAEAMRLLQATVAKSRKKADVFFVSDKCHPQTIALLQNRAEPVGIKLEIGDYQKLDITRKDVFGVLIQYPDTEGNIQNPEAFIAAANEAELKVAVATDLLALTLLKSPGEMGAEVVLGSAQRLGVPMGYGGPHAAFFATKEAHKRHIPGRIIGVTKDAEGNPAYRMALQTREQHIKREKATSNICTAQVLLAVMAGAYAVYHGADGMRDIALRLHGLARLTAKAATDLGYKILHEQYFDTLKMDLGEVSKENLKQIAEAQKVNFRYYENENAIGISFGEPHEIEQVNQIIEILAKAKNKKTITLDTENVDLGIETALQRTSPYMQHPIFEDYRTEHEMLRYLKRLENKDISLVHSMISLGSCTMKLNATAEMIPVTWSEFGAIHPFAPQKQAEGYSEIIQDLKKWLCEVTGFAEVSLQPNSGAQGEYAGLMTIRAYHLDRGDTHRNIALIPSSAHGTNPASAVMAGMKVVIVKCDERGNIDLKDLKAKAEKHSDNLAALMVTYPSTHGVFEESIQEICQTIHDHGGKVYMDGANMNAQVGLTSPARIGADVCHLNLHKTFCIPHGGGGPGMGPIGVTADLAPYLPSHPVLKVGGDKGILPISAAPYGSASILLISYAYIAMMGGEGLTRATERAILNANYIKSRIEGHFPILYLGKNGFSAHEFILDCREFKKTAGIEVVDIAKRLMDYGYHAPTVSFPVPGTMMVEPTESESKAELDRFCEALIQIRAEIAEIESGKANEENNVLKNAPHTAACLLTENWTLPYTREQAAYPLEWVRVRKYWAPVRRVDDAYGDRNLMCSCLPVEEYEEEQAL